MESPCDVVAWDTFDRFIAYGGGSCTLNSYHPLMSMTSTRTGEDDDPKECIFGIIDNSKRTQDRVMCDVFHKPWPSGHRHRDVPFAQMWLKDPGAPMSFTVHMPKALNLYIEHIIPRSTR